MAGDGGGEFRIDEYALEHVLNTQEWHLPFLPAIKIHPWLSLHGLMLIFAAGFLLLLFCVLYRKEQRVPHGFTNLLESLVMFIRNDIALPTLGPEVGRQMTPVLCNFFFFILVLNLMGMVPVFATATANINVTAALALITLTIMIGGAIYKKGILGFVKTFMPSGVPWPFLIIIIPIEFLGMFAKTAALTIRLFANMIAGHLVILTLIGLIALLGMIAVPFLAMAVFVSLLEILVAFLQAYIFTLLSALFIGQQLEPQH